jgi:hypothetical protein
MDIAGLENENPELGADLDTTYKALQRSKRDATRPPSAKELLSLADRLDGAAHA